MRCARPVDTHGRPNGQVSTAMRAFTRPALLVHIGFPCSRAISRTDVFAVHATPPFPSDLLIDEASYLHRYFLHHDAAKRAAPITARHNDAM